MIKTSKKKILVLSIVILVVGASVVLFTADSANPLRRSTDEIREDILELTPIGMSMDEVIKVMESNKEWDIYYVNERSGYVMNADRPGEPSPSDIEEGRVIGVKSARALIGTYQNIPHMAYVSVFWAFDEDSKLIDIAVRKG